MLGNFQVILAPFFAFAFVRFWDYFKVQTEAVQNAFLWLMIIQGIQCLFVVIFVFLKGCEDYTWKQVFNRAASVYVLGIAPILGIWAQIKYGKGSNEGQLMIFFSMYTAVSITNIVYQLVVYIPIMHGKLIPDDLSSLKYPFTLPDKNRDGQYQPLLNGEEDQPKEQDKPEYTKQRREPGSGKIRLDTHVEITQDIYSMLYVSHLKSDYIYFWKKVNKQKPEYVEINSEDEDEFINDKIQKFENQELD